MNTVVSPDQRFSISFQDPTQDENKFIEAVIFDSAGNKIDTIEFIHIATGLYQREIVLDSVEVFTIVVSSYDSELKLTLNETDFQYVTVRTDNPLGHGSTLITYNLKDKESNQPIVGALVEVTTDPLQQNRVAGAKKTDSLGNVTFLLDPFTKYFFWSTHPDFSFDNPDEEIFDSDGNAVQEP